MNLACYQSKPYYGAHPESHLDLMTPPISGRFLPHQPRTWFFPLACSGNPICHSSLVPLHSLSSVPLAVNFVLLKSELQSVKLS
jgi:hypothetical protein